MRHDPAAGAIIIMLRSLKMYGMAQAITDLIEQGAPAFEVTIPMLSQLLKAELAEREVRSIHCPAGDAYIAERGLSHEVRPLRAVAGSILNHKPTFATSEVPELSLLRAQTFYVS